MKLIWMGKYENIEQLKRGKLPENAVKFKEPNTPLMLNIIASIFVIPVIISLVIIAYIKSSIIENSTIDKIFFDFVANSDGSFTFSLNSVLVLGVLIGILMIIPHELLHAISFPQNSTVELWYAPKKLLAFAFSIDPVSKYRFIFISLIPSIVLGVIPMVVWTLIPYEYHNLSLFIFGFASINCLLAAGDYMNVFNAFIQVPKNAFTQLYGFNSYWFFK